MSEAYESITEVQTAAGFHVRVWHTESAEGDYDTRHNTLTELVRAHDGAKTSIATAIRTLPDWAAYQISDKYGNGRVVYATWP